MLAKSSFKASKIRILKNLEIFRALSIDKDLIKTSAVEFVRSIVAGADKPGYSVIIFSPHNGLFHSFEVQEEKD